MFYTILLSQVSSLFCCLYVTEKEKKSKKKEKYNFSSTIDWEIVAESKRESQSRVEISKLLKENKNRFSFLVFCQLLIDCGLDRFEARVIQK